MISEETRRKLRESHLGKKQSAESIEKRRQKMIGRVFSEEAKLKMSNYAKNRTKEHLEKLSNAQRGERGSNWKGGISPENERFRKTGAYSRWRKSVLIRDNYKCVNCGAVDVKLHVDHIKPFALFHELRLEVSNGRSLCIPCHRETDTYGVKKYTQKEL